MSDMDFYRNPEVSWGSLRPILQEMADRIAQLEQALAAAGLQVAQPSQAYTDAFSAVPASFGSVPDASLGVAPGTPPPTVGQAAAAAHGINLGGDISGQPSQIPDYIIQIARSGRKIEAIKELRNVTGMSLKEAKDVVDGLA
jgi:hypothetical protein